MCINSCVSNSCLASAACRRQYNAMEPADDLCMSTPPSPSEPEPAADAHLAIADWAELDADDGDDSAEPFELPDLNAWANLDADDDDDNGDVDLVAVSRPSETLRDRNRRLRHDIPMS